MSPPGDSRGRADAQLSRRPFPRGAGSGVGSQLCPSGNGPAKVTRPRRQPASHPWYSHHKAGEERREPFVSVPAEYELEFLLPDFVPARNFLS